MEQTPEAKELVQRLGAVQVEPKLYRITKPPSGIDLRCGSCQKHDKACDRLYLMKAVNGRTVLEQQKCTSCSLVCPGVKDKSLQLVPRADGSTIALVATSRPKNQKQYTAYSNNLDVPLPLDASQIPDKYLEETAGGKEDKGVKAGEKVGAGGDPATKDGTGTGIEGQGGASTARNVFASGASTKSAADITPQVASQAAPPNHTSAAAPNGSNAVANDTTSGSAQAAQSAAKRNGTKRKFNEEDSGDDDEQTPASDDGNNDQDSSSDADDSSEIGRPVSKQIRTAKSASKAATIAEPNDQQSSSKSNTAQKGKQPKVKTAAVGSATGTSKASTSSASADAAIKSANARKDGGAAAATASDRSTAHASMGESSGAASSTASNTGQSSTAGSAAGHKQQGSGGQNEQLKLMQQWLGMPIEQDDLEETKKWLVGRIHAKRIVKATDHLERMRQELKDFILDMRDEYDQGPANFSSSNMGTALELSEDQQTTEAQLKQKQQAFLDILERLSE